MAPTEEDEETEESEGAIKDRESLSVSSQSLGLLSCGWMPKRLFKSCTVHRSWLK